jgi:hypothetical protein
VANPIIKSPFSDAIGPAKVSEKGSAGGVYDTEPNLPSGIPSHSNSPNGVSELYRDKALTTKSPSTSGPLKTPFKDSVD